MTAILLTHPAKAAEKVCHEEQLRIWAEEIIGVLNIEGWLRDDLSYDDGIDIHNAIQREIKSIVSMAFTHPEAMKRETPTQ
jgi:hypothetical protein